MADEEMRYSTTVGPLPVLSDPSTWAPAWEREEARMGVTDTLAHATFRGIDPVRPANPFAKQISALPHARVPSLDDRASSITVVRRSREVGYRRSYLGFMDDPAVSPPLVPTFDYILACPPFIDVSDPEGPTTVQLTTARNHRSWLRPFDVPYTADILEARGYGPARGVCVAAVSAAHSPRYPGGGPEAPVSSVMTGAAGSSPPGSSPPVAPAAPSVGNSEDSHIVSFDHVEHRDIPNAAFDLLDHIPSDRVPQGLARMVACDPGEVRGNTTGTLVTGLCHTVVSLGDLIAQWARDHPGVPPCHVEELLQLVGRRNARAVLLREVGVAAGGANRRQQHQRDRDVYHKEPPAQRPRGPPGHGWGGSSSGHR